MCRRRRHVALRLPVPGPAGAAMERWCRPNTPSLGGRYWRYAPVIRFSDTPGQALPYCDKGEHTREILTPRSRLERGRVSG